jgi:hypothetical protein
LHVSEYTLIFRQDFGGATTKPGCILRRCPCSPTRETHEMTHLRLTHNSPTEIPNLPEDHFEFALVSRIKHTGIYEEVSAQSAVPP